LIGFVTGGFLGISDEMRNPCPEMADGKEGSVNSSSVSTHTNVIEPTAKDQFLPEKREGHQ
jgi:hypothetical protein